MILSLFLLRMMDGIQVLNTAMYLIYLYSFFLVGLGWWYRGGWRHPCKNYECLFNFVHAQYKSNARSRNHMPESSAHIRSYLNKGSIVRVGQAAPFSTKWNSSFWLGTLITPAPQPIALQRENAFLWRVNRSRKYVNMYCNRFHRYRCSDSLLESRSWLVVVVVAEL